MKPIVKGPPADCACGSDSTKGNGRWTFFPAISFAAQWKIHYHINSHQLLKGKPSTQIVKVKKCKQAMSRCVHGIKTMESSNSATEQAKHLTSVMVLQTMSLLELLLECSVVMSLPNQACLLTPYKTQS
jgi:hypothetical protein